MLKEAFKDFFRVFITTLLFLPTDKRKNMYKNPFYGFLSKPLNDIITMLIYFSVIILGCLFLDKTIYNVDFFFFYVKGFSGMDSAVQNTYSFLIYIYSFRIWPLIFFTFIYLISKLVRTTLIRRDKGSFRNKMNVQITPFIIHPIFLAVKLFVEYFCINKLAYLLTVNGENLVIKLFDNFFIKNWFITNEFYYLAIFGCCYMGIVIILTWPLSLAQYIAPDIEGNYRFTFFGRTVYVGNAEDGISSRLTKYYNNRGADDTDKIYCIRFFLRVNFLITGPLCKIMEDIMYIFFGCPIINCKDTWGHIR